MQRADGDSVAALAEQVGYFPVFASLAWVANTLDSAVTATTGQKAGV
jgi:hypothetical protein